MLNTLGLYDWERTGVCCCLMRFPMPRRERGWFAGVRILRYKQDLRPAQQEEEAGLAQEKLRRQLRTGRALLALGLSGGRMPASAQAAVWHGIL